MLLRLTLRRPRPAVARPPARSPVPRAARGPVPPRAAREPVPPRAARRAVLLLALTLGATLGAAPGAPAAAQEAPLPPEIAELDDKQVAERAGAALDRFDAGLDERDTERIREALVELAGLWPRLPEKTHRKVFKAARTLFSELKPRDEIREDGTDDAPGIRYAYETAVGLVFDKPDGDNVLAYALKQEHIEEWPVVQAHILTGLGFRQDPKQLDLLADYLDHEQQEVAAAAARGLGRLSEQDGKLRQAACAEIMDAWQDLAKRAEREARKDPDGEVNRLMQLLEAPFAEALTALSRQHHRGFEAWRRWFDEDAAGVEW